MSLSSWLFRRLKNRATAFGRYKSRTFLAVESLELRDVPTASIWRQAPQHVDAAYASSNFGARVDDSGVMTPQCLSITVNGNIAALVGEQRSRVASVELVFDKAVQLDANAVTLALHSKNVVFNGVAQPFGSARCRPVRVYRLFDLRRSGRRARSGARGDLRSMALGM